MTDRTGADEEADNDASGPAVLFLHGQPGLGRDWAEVGARLGPPYRVIAPDRPGYGHTGGAALGLLDNADAAIDLLDELGVEQAAVGGHSLGGAIALSMAQRYPDRVTGLVLVAPVGSGRALNALDRILAWPVVGERLAFVGFRYLSRFLTSPPARSGRFGPELAAVEPESMNARFDRWKAEEVWGPFSVEQRAMVAELPSITARLGQIHVPTVIVAGRRDSIVPGAASEELAGAIPGAELRWVAGGHLLTWEAPGAIAAAVVDVIRAARPGTAPDPPPPAQGCVS